MFYPQFKLDPKIQNAAKVILYLLQAMDTVTEEETRWTWCMQRRWEQKMLWYAIIL